MPWNISFNRFLDILLNVGSQSIQKANWQPWYDLHGTFNISSMASCWWQIYPKPHPRQDPKMFHGSSWIHDSMKFQTVCGDLWVMSFILIMDHDQWSKIIQYPATTMFIVWINQTRQLLIFELNGLNGRIPYVYSLNVITVASNIPFHSAEWSSIKALGTLKAASGVSLIT